MAKVQTKFDLGDKVFTVDSKTYKKREVTVGKIVIYLENDGNPSISIYPLNEEGRIDWNESIKEEVCFSTEAELMDYIAN